LGAHKEYIEDQETPVIDADLGFAGLGVQFLFQVSQLGRTEVIVKNDGLDVLGLRHIL